MRFDLRSQPSRFATVVAAVVLGFTAVPAATAATAATATPAQSRPTSGTALEWELEGISCTASSACTAAGDEENSAGEAVPLAERWNGSSWSVQSTPTPAGSQASYFNGVSCASASACTAVGQFVTGTEGSAMLAEHWNGSTWSVQSTPAPTGAEDTYLYAVSCASATACMAVGNYITSTGAYAMLAESWNGTSWTLQSAPAPAGEVELYVSGVSCPSTTACTATGYYETSTGDFLSMAESWNGTSWSLKTTVNPTGAAQAFLSGISCTSATACIAAGYQETSTGTTSTLAEVWNGTTWAIQTTPNPSGTTIAGLIGISCTTASACTAVGWYETSPEQYDTLAERWNGTTWTIQTTPNPTGATDNYLNGVSCTSATACSAAGYDITTTYESLAEGWNGTSWALQSTAHP